MHMVGSGCPILLSVISHQKNRFLSRKETCGPVLSIYPAYLLCVLEPEELFFTFELKNNLNVKTLKIFPQKYLNNSLS